MTFEERLGFRYVRPLGKTLAPPQIVFGRGMKLRQEEGEKTNGSCGGFGCSISPLKRESPAEGGRGWSGRTLARGLHGHCLGDHLIDIPKLIF